MIFNSALDCNTSHTVLDVKAPVRLVCLGHAGIAPGVYKMEGDLRPKFITEADQRLVLAGLLTVTYHEAGAPTTPYVGKETPVPTMEYVTPEKERPAIEIITEEKCKLVESTETGGTASEGHDFDNAIGTDEEPIVVLDDKPKRRGRPPKAKEMQPVNEDATV